MVHIPFVVVVSVMAVGDGYGGIGFEFSGQQLPSASVMASRYEYEYGIHCCIELYYRIDE
jgi:hypothetical protein